MSPTGVYDEDEIYGPDPDEREVWPFDDKLDIIRREDNHNQIPTLSVTA